MCACTVAAWPSSLEIVRLLALDVLRHTRHVRTLSLHAALKALLLRVDVCLSLLMSYDPLLTLSTLCMCVVCCALCVVLWVLYTYRDEPEAVAKLEEIVRFLGQNALKARLRSGYLPPALFTLRSFFVRVC